MSRSLPPHPTLEALKKQAKELLAGHKSADAAVCGTLRLLRRLAEATDAEILAADLSLSDAQFALAMDYGFESWAALKSHVEAVAGEKPMSATVFGRVTAETGGQPIEGAEMRIQLQDATNEPHAYACVRTDADGRYDAQFTWIGGERLAVYWQCRHPAYRFHREFEDEPGYVVALKRLGDGDRHEVSPKLRDGYAVELTVRDDRGGRVVGAEALVSSTDGFNGGPLITDYVTGEPGYLLVFPLTDAGGRCRVEGLAADIPAGFRYQAVILHDDFEFFGLSDIDKLPRADRVARATVQLSRGHELTGQVVSDETGQPIEGATVDAARDFEPGELEDRDWGHWTSKDTTTGPDGRFALKGLRDLPHRLTVKHSRWMTKKLDSVAVPSDGPLTIRLEAGRTVTGQVLDRDGRPAGGAQIGARQADKSWPEFYATTHADPQGRFVLGGLPADATLYLVAKGESPYVYFGFRAIESDQDHVAFDARELVEVAGGAIDPESGQPVATRVSCTAYGTFPGGASQLCSAVPLESGRFRLLLPPSGEITLALFDNGDVFGSPFMNELNITMRDGKCDRSLDVVAAEPYKLSVRVVDDGTDRPIERAGVDILTAPDQWGLGYPNRTDADGRAAWDCLPPCDLVITVIANGYETVEDRRLSMPVDEEVVIRLAPRT